jgi:hypothetical protein
LPSLTVTVSARWLNRWLLVPLARPYVRVDGRERPLRWGRPAELPVPPGTHAVEVYLRYRGSRRNLGTGRLDVPIGPTDHRVVTAVNGALNHTPFRLRLAAPAAAQMSRS